MRIRSLKPGFWISSDIAQLEEIAAHHYTGIWCYCQDNGVGRDDPRLIKAALYALRDAVTVEEVSRRQDILEEAGLIVRYTDGGVPLFYIPTWDQHQRVAKPSHSKYGRPTGILPEPSRTPPGTPANGVGNGGMDMGVGNGEKDVVGAAGAAEQVTNPMGEIMQAVRKHLYIPDGKPPRDWTERRCASIAKAKLDQGTPVGEILDAIEGLTILRDSGELDWLKRGHKTTMKALYYTHSGAVPTWTLALDAMHKAPPSRRGKSQPTALDDILGMVKGAA